MIIPNCEHDAESVVGPQSHTRDPRQLFSWGWSASEFSLEALEEATHNHELPALETRLSAAWALNHTQLEKHGEVVSDQSNEGSKPKQSKRKKKSQTPAGGVVGGAQTVAGDRVVHVHVDSRSMGVGGYDSWSPNVDREHLVLPAGSSEALVVHVLLLPLSAGDDPVERYTAFRRGHHGAYGEVL